MYKIYREEEEGIQYQTHVICSWFTYNFTFIKYFDSYLLETQIFYRKRQTIVLAHYVGLNIEVFILCFFLVFAVLLTKGFVKQTFFMLATSILYFL
jgi:hypothetical protein